MFAMQSLTLPSLNKLEFRKVTSAPGDSPSTQVPSEDGGINDRNLELGSMLEIFGFLRLALVM